MQNKTLFLCDWPDQVENTKVLQELLDRDYSENTEWKVWSCKRGNDHRLLYRWFCYTKGALYVIRNRKKYHTIIIWQQMVGFILFELLRITHLKSSNIVFCSIITESNVVFRYFKKHFIKNSLRFSKAVIWPTLAMLNEAKNDFPEFGIKNHYIKNPLFDVIDTNFPLDGKLDDPSFRNGVYTAGKSERDFNIVIRAFKNTEIPVTIVCCDDYIFTESNITSNIRILTFSQVSHEQYYALASQAFCILISVINEKSPCGQIITNFAMANSIPIIATECNAVRDIIDHNINGILFKVGQSDEIRQGYEKLKNDAEFTKSLIRNAKIKHNEISPGIFIKKVQNIIEN
jgi:glycosyltransferase involved in cell wall biosynthesis